jgi:hypothetical protein
VGPEEWVVVLLAEVWEFKDCKRRPGSKLRMSILHREGKGKAGTNVFLSGRWYLKVE